MPDGGRGQTRSEPDDRRYTYGGHVAHLLPFTSTGHYALARCGYAPAWPAEWLGSGSQGERDEAERLPACKRCERMAAAEATHREAVSRQGHGFVGRPLRPTASASRGAEPWCDQHRQAMPLCIRDGKTHVIPNPPDDARSQTAGQ